MASLMRTGCVLRPNRLRRTFPVGQDLLHHLADGGGRERQCDVPGMSPRVLMPRTAPALADQAWPTREARQVLGAALEVVGDPGSAAGAPGLGSPWRR